MRTAGVAALLLGVTAAAFAAATYEIEGRLEPPRQGVLVSLHGASSPFAANTRSNGKGRFRFKGLVPGPYTLIAFAPGTNEIRLTVEVSAGLAGKNRRVPVVVPIGAAASREALERAHAISARELSIPDSAKRDFGEAQALLSRRQVAAAIKRLERAVQRAPQYVEAWNNLGTIAYHEGRYQDAERFFRTALRHEPAAYLPSVNLGGVLVTMGRFEEALEINRYAVAQGKGDALANVQLGMNYYFLNQFEPALKYLLEAKRIDPNHFSHPQRFLANIYFRKGDVAAALAELDDFLERHPDDRNAPAVREMARALRAK